MTSTAITFEMFRDGGWEELRSPPEVDVSASSLGITVTLRGSAQPPFRVLCDGVVIFERSV